MKTMGNYLIIMLTIMLFIFRLIVIFTTIMGIEFAIQSINVKFEIILLFVMIISIILICKNKLSGPIILTFSSFAYYGPDLLSKYKNILPNSINIEDSLQATSSIVAIIIPIFAFFIIAVAKKQERKPVNKKTDFFYKNDQYDRKYDKSADKNNYRTL